MIYTDAYPKYTRQEICALDLFAQFLEWIEHRSVELLDIKTDNQMSAG